MLGPKEAKAPSRSGREPQVRLATLVARVAHAVHFAHQHGIIHRDLKPNNILIDADEQPHLTDFGIAKVLERDSGLTRTNDVLGTPAYMAPEQALGRAVSSSVDVYSLGAILYELLTGRPPFRGQTPFETLRLAAEEEPVPPTTMNGNADVELAAICLKCLEKTPMHRYGSALAVAEDLERWIRNEPILGRRAGPAARMVRWARRNPVGASLILTLCAGLIGALGLLRMVNAEKNKTTKVLREVELVGQTNALLLTLTVSMLHEQLEGLWLSNDRRMLEIKSEQLAALSGLPIIEVPKKALCERYTFGLSANESPVADSRRYALLLAYLEGRLSERRGRPVRIDLHIFKFKEDRRQVFLAGKLDLARMSPIVYLKMKKEHPGVQALVVAESLPRQAVFFTRAGTGIRTLADLKGRKLAFGDWDQAITLWAQEKLRSAGITGRDLGGYAILDSRAEFIEELHELRLEADSIRKLWLHSTGGVIEGVIDGRYDAGMTSLRGFDRNKHRGLVQIPGSEFTTTQSPYLAREHLPADVVRDFVEALTAIRGEAFPEEIRSRRV